MDSARLSVDNAPRVIGGAPNNAEPAFAAVGGTRAAEPAPRGRFGGSGTPDSNRTGLADPPEDWTAADLLAAQRLLQSFRDSTRSTIAQSVSVACVFYSMS